MLGGLDSENDHNFDFQIQTFTVQYKFGKKTCPYVFLSKFLHNNIFSSCHYTVHFLTYSAVPKPLKSTH